jgi:hypothetical protein
MIERKIDTQHDFAFRPPTKTTNQIKSRDYNNMKYHRLGKDKKKKNPCHKCGKKWIPGHKCEYMSLCYYTIVYGKQVEVPRLDNKITITYNSNSNDD